MKPEPVGKWFMVSCATCGVLVGWTREPFPRFFYCIPHFDDVAHVPDDFTVEAAIAKAREQ